MPDLKLKYFSVSVWTRIAQFAGGCVKREQDNVADESMLLDNFRLPSVIEQNRPRQLGRNLITQHQLLSTMDSESTIDNNINYTLIGLTCISRTN